MVDSNKRTFERYLEENRKQLGRVIHDLWISKQPALWRSDPYFYFRLATDADGLGQYMFAREIVTEGLEFFPGNLRLIQLLSLTSYNCGFHLQARDLLVGLMKRGHQDAQTLGALARIYREMWLAANQENRTHPFLTRSKNLYLKAFLADRGFDSGINAAIMCRLSGDRERSDRLARQVLSICSKLRNSSSDPELFSTVGEACTLLDMRKEAFDYYRHASRLAATHYDDLARMRSRLGLLQEFSPAVDELIDSLHAPRVVALVTLPGTGRRTTFRGLAPGLADEGVRRIADLLEERPGTIGYVSGGSGAELLLLEAIHERGGETNLFLPFDRDELFPTETDLSGREWSHRLEQSFDRCSSVEQVIPGDPVRVDVLLSFASRIAVGKALLRSRSLGSEPLLIAIGKPSQLRRGGDTAGLVRSWEKLGHPVEFIELSLPPPRAGRHLRSGSETRPAYEVLSIVIGDLVGYSRLAEEQLPHFVDDFLGAVAKRLARSNFRPLHQNVCGDSVFFVFADCAPAAEWALSLRDLVRQTDWKRRGLPEKLSMRIALHAGPLFRSRDAFLKRDNFYGYHLNEATRIEASVSPGNVYASEEFAALLAEGQPAHIECRPAGTIFVPGSSKDRAVYHVKRPGEID